MPVAHSQHSPLPNINKLPLRKKAKDKGFLRNAMTLTIIHENNISPARVNVLYTRMVRQGNVNLRARIKAMGGGVREYNITAVRAGRAKSSFLLHRGVHAVCPMLQLSFQAPFCMFRKRSFGKGSRPLIKLTLIADWRSSTRRSMRAF